MKTLRSLFGLTALICILSLPVNAFTQGHNNYDDVVIEIISEGRGSLPLFSVPSKRPTLERLYIVANQNEPYRIRVSNKSNRRMGVVLSIDGRNILSGQVSELEWYEPMCILKPYQTKYYSGWQSERYKINRFIFTNMNRSYSRNWYSRNGMGTIALAVFNEKQQDRNSHDNTHWGKNEKSAAPHGRTVRFTPAKRAIAEKIIRYESRENLCRKGIVQCGPRYRKNHFPQAKGQQNNRYASSPSWHFELRL